MIEMAEVHIPVATEDSKKAVRYFRDRLENCKVKDTELFITYYGPSWTIEFHKDEIELFFDYDHDSGLSLLKEILGLVSPIGKTWIRILGELKYEDLNILLDFANNQKHFCDSLELDLSIRLAPELRVKYTIDAEVKKEHIEPFVREFVKRGVGYASS